MTVVQIHLGGHRLPGPGDHLLEVPRRPRTTEDSTELPCVLVLGGINAESDVRPLGFQVLQIGDQLVLRVVTPRAQIRQPRQVTQLHVVLARIIGHSTIRALIPPVVVEVVLGILRRGKRAVAEGRPGDTGAPAGSHVVDHCVHHHTHPQRSCKLKAGACDAEGFHVINLGMGGASNSKLSKSPAPIWDFLDGTHHGYVRMTASRERLAMEYIRGSEPDKVTDKLELTREAAMMLAMQWV
mmetsp:Transcript_14904/g.37765  ORF Transcript_14904/g.37765 Transcript_14904/m.37765 type:complete len:240 (-) Transcript_14904:95-814(-)